MTTKNRKPAIRARWGRAKPTTRLTVSRGELLLDHGAVAARRAEHGPGTHPTHAPPSLAVDLSVASDKIAEPTDLCFPLGQPLRLQVLSRCLQQGLGLPDGPGVAGEESLDQVRGGRVQLVTGYDGGGDAQLAGLVCLDVPRGGADLQRPRSPTRSTSGFVPARSGTRPSAGSFMQNFTSSATTRRSHARASWKPAPMA